MQQTLPGLKIERAARSRLPEVDFTGLGFGNYFSDHMFSVRYVDGAWGQAEIIPYGPISLEPGCLSLHYGQSVFEGLKAFRGTDGRIRVFRADRNAARLDDSCARLCIPALPAGLLEDAVEELVRLDQAWIPRGRGEALYIRPIIFAEESHLQVRPAASYRFLILTAPVGTYYGEGFVTVGLRVEDQFTRAAAGGVGFAKTAGNYAASLYPGHCSREEGFDQALWLDGESHRYVEEVGQMNIFFHLEEEVVTPELRGTILPGVTRDSVITLLREKGYPVSERRISVRELIEASEAGTLHEAFGSGTATVIAPVGRIGFEGREHLINGNAAGPLAKMLYHEILGIQLGETEDRHGWTREVELLEEPRAASA